METPNRAQWVNEVEALLIKATGPAENENQAKNLREWAEALAESFYDEPLKDGDEPETPAQAVWEEMQAGM